MMQVGMNFEREIVEEEVQLERVEVKNEWNEDMM